MSKADFTLQVENRVRYAGVILCFSIMKIFAVCRCDCQLIMGELTHSREYLSFRSSIPLRKVRHILLLSSVVDLCTTFTDCQHAALKCKHANLSCTLNTQL